MVYVDGETKKIETSIPKYFDILDEEEIMMRELYDSVYENTDKIMETLEINLDTRFIKKLLEDGYNEKEAHALSLTMMILLIKKIDT